MTSTELTYLLELTEISSMFQRMLQYFNFECHSLTPESILGILALNEHFIYQFGLSS